MYSAVRLPGCPTTLRPTLDWPESELRVAGGVRRNILTLIGNITIKY